MSRINKLTKELGMLHKRKDEIKQELQTLLQKRIKKYGAKFITGRRRNENSF